MSATQFIREWIPKGEFFILESWGLVGQRTIGSSRQEEVLFNMECASGWWRSTGIPFKEEKPELFTSRCDECGWRSYIIDLKNFVNERSEIGCCRNCGKRLTNSHSLGAVDYSLLKLGPESEPEPEPDPNEDRTVYLS